MPRKTLQDALDSRIPEAVNLPPGDSRVIQYINEAQDKLLKRGHWWGTMGRFSMSATSGLITMPRQIAAIERVSVCQVVTPLHDFWFEWLDNGWGPVDESKPDGRPSCEYRGHYPLFSDIVGTGKKLRFICDLQIDSGKSVLVQGFDDATPPNWLRSQIGSTGTFQNGISMTMGQATDPAVYSPSNVGKVTDIILPNDMQGQCWCYEYDTVLLTQRLVGQFDAGISRPSFPRYFFPGILVQDPAVPVTVECLAKLEFIPVKVSTDFLMIGNLPALKLACMAIKAEEELRFMDAALLMDGGLNRKTGINVRGAINELDSELDHYLGTGRKIGMNIQGFNLGAVEAVPNLL